jgi:hypothetical protein
MVASTYGVPPEAISAVSGAAKGYIDKPSAYRGKKAMGSLGKDALMGVAKDKLTSMGTDYLKTTNPELYAQAKAIQDDYKAIKAASKAISQDEQDRINQRLFSERGYGLYAGSGSGLYAGRGYGIMGRGAIMSVSSSHLPPALQSQNTSANFHFSTQLPPQFASLK